ncbi:MAG: hypothetical protein OXF11_10115 [Deltaproteobacteria bacterium]|nr:hypothetical protein [Deltaproteobacteria bacterium]
MSQRGTTPRGPGEPGVRGKPGLNSRAIIDACRPYEWAKDFPPVSGASPELKEKVLERFGGYLKG